MEKKVLMPKPKLKLAVFDVDGTLTSVDSCWRFIHEKLGTWQDGGAKNAELFFRGEISYDEWARRDVSLWKETSINEIQKIVFEIPYVDGIYEVFRFLRENDVKIVLLSAGLSFIAERIAKEFGVNDYIANELEIVNGKVTGNVKIRVSIDNKGEILEELLRKFRVKPEECLAVGDDLTMIPVFQKVGLSIAFNPQNQEIAKYAKITVNERDLRKILSYVKEYL